MWDEPAPGGAASRKGFRKKAIAGVTTYDRTTDEI
jgi:hypothetical protein